MRTKALLVAAVLAAGLATSMAQNVYSLNVVGYYNVTVPANGFAMIANQFNTADNKISALIPNPPLGTSLFKFDAGYTTYIFDEFDEVWMPNGDATLNPGEGAFIKNVTGSPMTLTFVGEVPQGELQSDLPAGFSIRSSMVPQAGAATSVLGFPAQPGDSIFKYADGYTTYIFDEFDEVWLPNDPVIGVGEAFFTKKINAGNWARNFSVPQ